jgi:hypothetical protein
VLWMKAVETNGTQDTFSIILTVFKALKRNCYSVSYPENLRADFDQILYWKFAGYYSSASSVLHNLYGNISKLTFIN